MTRQDRPTLVQTPPSLPPLCRGGHFHLHGRLRCHLGCLQRYCHAGTRAPGVRGLCLCRWYGTVVTVVRTGVGMDPLLPVFSPPPKLDGGAELQMVPVALSAPPRPPPEGSIQTPPPRLASMSARASMTVLDSMLPTTLLLAVSMSSTAMSHELSISDADGQRRTHCATSLAERPAGAARLLLVADRHPAKQLADPGVCPRR